MFQDSQTSLDTKTSTFNSSSPVVDKTSTGEDNHVCLGPYRSPPMHTDSRHVCILCLVDDEVEVSSEDFIFHCKIKFDQILVISKALFSWFFSQTTWNLQVKLKDKLRNFMEVFCTYFCSF